MNHPPIPSQDIAPRAALISPDPSFGSLITSCLGEQVASVEWVLRAEMAVTELRPENVDALAGRQPDLLFIDVGESPSPGARFISALTERVPDLTVVAAGAPLDVDDLLSVIRAGASGYLRRPLNHQEVAEACVGVLRKIRANAGREPEQVARLFALFSPKGGTGVSTLATNLAVHIRRATHKRILLVDFSPDLGTCSILLGLEPRYSYVDVIESLHRMDEGLLHSFLEEHESGTRVLASPMDLFGSREVTSENVAQLVRLLRRHFDYIVVDVGRGTMDHAAVKAIELADEKLVVTTTELPTLRNVKRVLSHLSRRDDPTENSIRLIVNRYEEGRSVPKKDIERAVGLSLFQTIEEDRGPLSRSINLGQPIVMNGSSSYSIAVGSVGDRLAPPDAPTSKRRLSLGRLVRAVLPPYGRANGTRQPARSASNAGRAPRRKPTTP